MSWPAGTRVKKVRGALNIGATGVVSDPPEDVKDNPTYPSLFAMLFPGCMWVRVDVAGVGYPCLKPGSAEIPTKAGELVITSASEWEPIVPDGHRPCEEDFNLPEFLNEQRESADASNR